MSGLRLACYGDDVSGSSDVLEVLAHLWCVGKPTR